ncbi:MAG: hypothetical protein NWE94_05195 [Candidatus Bathyarchaeota archaeon]|nr:hypothetical protein [Candidatus Bathyarchaeota archaeon]
MTKELFVQRTDAFTTDLIDLLNSLKKGEIFEIMYSCGFDGFIRIFLDEHGKFLGEFSSKSEKSLQEVKSKLGI